jgi:hypothetical protein
LSPFAMLAAPVAVAFSPFAAAVMPVAVALVPLATLPWAVAVAKLPFAELLTPSPLRWRLWLAERAGRGREGAVGSLRAPIAVALSPLALEPHARLRQRRQTATHEERGFAYLTRSLRFSKIE